jgi:hypothetical protein
LLSALEQLLAERLAERCAIGLGPVGFETALEFPALGIGQREDLRGFRNPLPEVLGEMYSLSDRIRHRTKIWNDGFAMPPVGWR